MFPRTIACLLLAALALPASAQFFPPPVVAVPVGPSSSIGFRYRHGGLTVRGAVFNGPQGVILAPVYPGPIVPIVRGYPFGVVENRVNVQIIQPTVVLEPRRIRIPEEYDLTGVDLDLKPPPRVERDAKVAPIPKPRVEEKPQVAKAPEPKPVVVPPKIERPEPVIPKPRVAKPEPKPELLDEAKRLTELGAEAARRSEWGLAALRFRQANITAPLDATPWIWLAHAQVALGKFSESEDSLLQGLKLNRSWLKDDARPLKHLYDGNLDTYQQHRRAVEESVMREPQRSNRRFLLAYLLWYEGRRDLAAEQLALAKPGLADPTLVDIFQ